MVLATNLGFPRVGAQRELKKAQESYWKGEISAEELQQTAKELRKTHWQAQQRAGLDHIPSNDFTFYDHVLDTIAMTGAVPARYEWKGGNVDLDTFFAMARGRKVKGESGIPAMEMTKWFDTNYHYIVPEFHKGQSFAYSTKKAVEQFLEAKALGITTRPVLLGPVSFLLLGKAKDADFNPIDLLSNLLPVYETVLAELANAGATWIQMDEPFLVMDQTSEQLAAYRSAYAILSAAAGSAKLLVATYFGDTRGNLDTLLNLPVAAVHLDLVRGPAQLDAALKVLPGDKIVSLGVINGRNIWKTDLNAALDTINRAVTALGRERVMVAPSCSLLHSPVDLTHETKLDDELKNWLAFAAQKLDEISILARAANQGEAAVADQLKANKAAIASRNSSPRIHNPEVKRRVAGITEAMLKRKNPFAKRILLQQQHLKLPLLPTTTIGSFPQTQEVRAARADFKAGKINEKQYNAFLEKETENTIRVQEELDIDVLVHGEFERNDMVEYFGEQLAGFAFTKNGWVQSYGSRCVKPPIIYGDVYRPHPMTVDWAKFAQALTSRPVKGMLTGPITILQWSFVRDDQPRDETCRQIGLAIRDEVVDLEKAGIKVIQIDEPAIREGLPLRRDEWAFYLKWAVDAFRLSAAGVSDETQIHTHMCYSEFNDVIDSIAAMDADVISIETSRSQMELLDAFVNFRYPNQIGPGVYDIHSPLVPTQEEMEHLLEKALKVLAPEQIWVNPDCGLKTRGWPEVKSALEKMVQAAKTLRAKLPAQYKQAANQ